MFKVTSIIPETLKESIDCYKTRFSHSMALSASLKDVIFKDVLRKKLLWKNSCDSLDVALFLSWKRDVELFS